MIKHKAVMWLVYIQSYWDITHVRSHYSWKTSTVKQPFIGTLLCNEIVDHSEVVGHIACRRCSNYISIFDLTPGLMDWTKTPAERDEEYLSFGRWCTVYQRFEGAYLLHYHGCWWSTPQHLAKQRAVASVATSKYSLRKRFWKFHLQMAASILIFIVIIERIMHCCSDISTSYD